jgi:phenylalanyl-tRNA synthetase beta chain
MRTSLWPGLIDTAIGNINRQQGRIRIFESGLKFVRPEGELIQSKAVALLAMGPVNDEQWGERARMIDFFDIKADVEAIVHLTGRAADLEFRDSQHTALHPGQSAEIFLKGQHLGWIGMLHPSLERELGLDRRVFLAELDQVVLTDRDIPKFSKLSRFPSVRRDLAFIVDRQTANADIVKCVTESAASQGIFQDDSETLVDAAVDATVQAVIEALVTRFDARLRE